MKRSPWFPVSKKPDLPGWYEYLPPRYIGFHSAYWDGEHWLVDSGNMDVKYVVYRPNEDDKWRGLAEKPE